MKVVFAGGGTGGHLYPSISLAEKLQKNNIDFCFLVSDRGIEAKILTPMGYKFEEQKVSAFMGQGIKGKIKALLNMVKATKRAYSLIDKEDKVFLTGGFAAAPSAIVAKLKGCELYLHEQNSVMGLVNRIFAKMSKKVFLSFVDTKNAKGNTIVTGNPVREIFYNLENKKDFTGNILILGGSQGSRIINKLIASSIVQIIEAGFNVIHQTGSKLYDETVETYGDYINKYKDKISVVKYIDNVALEMNKADILISRSGAGAVFEARALNLPAIFIPFGSASENHQYYNALEVENYGGCIIIDEKKADELSLITALNKIKDNINGFRDNLKNNPIIKSSDKIFEEMNF